MDKCIIDEMRSYLSENENCINDFEKYDINELEENLEPFFWMVRECGTSLCHIGPSRMNNLFRNEASRFQIFRDNDAPIASLKYWKDNGKVFFFDGFQLVNITPADIDVIYANIWHGEIERLKEKHPAEYEMRNKPLEIRMEEQVAERLEKSKEFANSIMDTSLEDCLTRLSKHSRLGIDHYIGLFPDFSKHGYIFCEYLNNECRMNGGIIYHGNPKEGYKENSSVQINPSYGWSIHT